MESLRRRRHQEIKALKMYGNVRTRCNQRSYKVPKRLVQAGDEIDQHTYCSATSVAPKTACLTEMFGKCHKGWTYRKESG